MDRHAKPKDAVVIGAGPGGLVAALYLRRFLRTVTLISCEAPRASWIPRTHNLIGYDQGISGAALLKHLHSQLDCVGIERIVSDVVVHPSRSGGFEISSVKNRRAAYESVKLRARYVVVATGVSDVQPQLKNMERLRRCGLLRYCPVCDAFEHKDKKLLVLAQDTHGLRTARFLREFSKDISILWPESEAVTKQAERTGRLAGVRLLRGAVKRVQETKSGQARVFFETKNRNEKDEMFDAIYVALGVTVNDSAFRHLRKMKRDEDGYILTNRHQETAIPGLFAVGDCVAGLSQINVAAGQAAIAATAIHNGLRAAAASRFSRYS